MSIKETFAKSLNIEGRIGRLTHFWRKLLLLAILVPITVVALILISVIAGRLGETPALGSSVTVDFFFMILFLIYAYVLGLLWNVVTVLRLHDLDLDGRWCAVNFIVFIPLILILFRIYIPQPGHYPLIYTLPVALFVLFNLYLLFVRGTRGPNKYGPDPFGEKAPKPYNPKVTAKPYQIKAKTPVKKPAATVSRTTLKHQDRYKPKNAKKG